MKYFAQFIGDSYATEFFPSNCTNIKCLKEHVKGWLGVSRLPNGTEVWIDKK